MAFDRLLARLVAVAADRWLLKGGFALAVGPVARMRYGWLLRQGRHAEHPDVVLTRCRTVELAGPPLPINSDGELGDEISQRRWTVQPRAWRILAPAAIREANRPA